MRLPHAHPKGERDWYPLALLLAIGFVILTVVMWGVPSGMPS